MAPLSVMELLCTGARSQATASANHPEISPRRRVGMNRRGERLRNPNLLKEKS